MNWLDSIAKPGGQLLGCYVLAIVLLVIAPPSAGTTEKLLFLVIGAVLRDMQDSRASSVINSPGARITTTEPTKDKS